ncbi:MAG TPA: SPOR domain-containing protein [Allosphingosinicella sp.]
MMLAAVPAAAQVGPPAGQSSGDQLSHNLRLLAQNPRSLTALMGAGKAALELGDAAAALTFFARAEEAAPRDGRIKMYIGSALVQMEKPASAMKFFQEASSLGVPEAELAGERGLAYDLTGDSRRAQADYRLALSRARNPEVTRRLALSLAISGEREPALQLLADQLLVRDPAGQRTRALVLALTGDAQGATRAAEGAMPVQQAAAMAPFLARLPVLAPRDRALAVHFGHFPENARNLPVPPPRTYAAATVPPAAATTSTARGKRRTYTAAPATRGARPAEAPPVQIAARTPVPQAAATQPAASKPATPKPRASTSTERTPAATAWSWSRGLDAPRTTTRKPDLAPRPAVQTAQRQPAPAPQQATPAPVQIAQAQPQRAPVQQQPVQVAQAQPAPVQSAPIQQTPVQVAQIQPQPAPAQQQPVQLAQAQPSSPPPIARANTPAASVSGPVDTGATPGFSFGQSLASAAPQPAQVQPAQVQPAPEVQSGSALAQTAATAPAETPKPAAPAIQLAELAPSTVAAPSAPTPAPTPTPRRIADLAAALADIPEAEIAKPEPAPAPARKPAATPPAKKPAATASADKKPSAAETAAEKKKAAANAAAKKPTPAAPKEPARIWVQVAGGAVKAALPREFARLKTKAPKALAARAAWTTPLNATNRLLVGPFASAKEAQAFVNELAKEDLSAFAWTSDAGQKIEKLSAK